MLDSNPNGNQVDKRDQKTFKKLKYFDGLIGLSPNPAGVSSVPFLENLVKQVRTGFVLNS